MQVANEECKRFFRWFKDDLKLQDLAASDPLVLVGTTVKSGPSRKMLNLQAGWSTSHLQLHV